jgi:hypothetical protein
MNTNLIQQILNIWKIKNFAIKYIIKDKDKIVILRCKQSCTFINDLIAKKSKVKP